MLDLLLHDSMILTTSWLRYRPNVPPVGYYGLSLREEKVPLSHSEN
jgi:hypothetical protein